MVTFQHCWIVCICLLNLINSELVQLLAIWRHGDRAPRNLRYKNDPNREAAWPRGWQQLTNIGIQETFELGVFLRERYVEKQKLFGPFFDRKKVFIQSSDQERALESAQAVAAGLFPPSGDRVWNASFPWQPTPIHSNWADRNRDMILRPKAYGCPKFERINKTDHVSVGLQLDREYGDFFKYLSEKTGTVFNGTNSDTLNEIALEIRHGLPQPDWVNGKFGNLSVLSTILQTKKRLRLAEFNSAEKGKFLGGILLNNLLTYMEAKRDEKKTFDAVLYSSHDDGLYALLSALGMLNELLVPSTSVILFEISNNNHSSINGLSVQIFYRNTTQHPPYLMEIPKCSNPCPLKDLLKIYEPMRVRSEKEWKELCRDDNGSREISLLPIVLAVLFFINYK